MEEIWKDISGYEGKYQVSDRGQVRSLSCKFVGNGRILKQFKMGQYLAVSFYIFKKKVHRLVWEAFNNATIPDKYVVHHIDGNKLNNNITNLALVTMRMNVSIHHMSNACKQTSKYLGVYWDKSAKKWKAQIAVKNKKINLGRYRCETKAMFVYQLALQQIQKDANQGELI